MEVSGATPLHGSSTSESPLRHMSAKEINRAEMEEWDQEIEQLLTPMHTQTKGSLLKTQTGQTPMILWGILRPKRHLRYRTGSEMAQRI